MAAVNELVELVPQYVEEATRDFAARRPKTEKELLDAMFVLPEDRDRAGWIGLFALALQGVALKEQIATNEAGPELTSRLQNQLTWDNERYGDTWKHRAVEKQGERTRDSFRNYRDQFEHGGQELPWRKFAGHLLINTFRLDHPEYTAPDAKP